MFHCTLVNWRGARHMAALLATLVTAASCSLSGKPMFASHSSSPSAAVQAAEDNSSLANMTMPELREAADSMGKSYAANPKDQGAALRYAEVLGIVGRSDQSLAVMRKLAIDYPTDRKVLAAYGKSLAAVGEFKTALDAIRRAQRPEYPDWRLMSAEAAILDQLGEHAKARALYDRALQLAPEEPSVLSNLGMSHVLTGDLKTAEKHLRRAASVPGADSRVRQNLALVIGLQGRYKEAEAIARKEIGKDNASANLSYLRSLRVEQSASPVRGSETRVN